MTPAFAQSSSTEACNADIDQQGTVLADTYSGIVSLADYAIFVSDFLQPSPKNPRSNINKDAQNQVDLVDYTIFVRWFTKSVVCPKPSTTPSPTPIIPSPSTTEWSQFGQNAQHTHYSPLNIKTPWRYKWQWNGADASGKKQANHLQVPDLVQPITGDGRVYMIAGNGVYALDRANGSIVWTKNSLGSLNATPVYDKGSLYVPSANGSIYKLNATNGTILSTFSGPSPFNLSLTLGNDTLFAVSSSGILYAINPNTMQEIWKYSAGSIGSTPASYASTKNLVIFVTQDLYVHAVHADTGTRAWKTKPTIRTYEAGNLSSSGAQAEEGWPVIAQQHGIVFIRYRLDWNTLWTWSPFPDSLSAIRANLTENPLQQALFALNLDTGAQAFIPLAGNGGAGDGGYLPMGTQPVIRNVDGKEVAYILWRNQQTCMNTSWCDGRDDATMGEMVLDNTTVPGYQAGDIRFVKNPDVQTDEMMNIAMGGDILFHSHWLINSAVQITDRSNSLGNSFSNPIRTTNAPYVIWRQCNNTNTCNYPGCTGNTVCGINCPTSPSRYCSQGLYSYGDARSYPAGFYEYNNDINSGSTPFTVVSDAMVLVKTNDGAVMAFESGSPTANSSMGSSVTKRQTSTSILGLQNPTRISYTQAFQHMGEEVVVEGKILSAVNRMPKAIYLGFSDPHDGSLLLRVFAKDLSRFPYDPMTLRGKNVRIHGVVSSYWPENIDPEISIQDPAQVEILDPM